MRKTRRGFLYTANLLATIGILAQAAFIVVLVWRSTYKSLHVFFLYIVWGLAGDSTVLILRTVMHSQSLYPFEIETYIDSFFQYLVLIELAWSILRPIQRSLPKRFLLGISLIIAAAAVLAWPLSGIKETMGYPWQLLIALHAQRSFAILRILFFIALACCSHFLGIGWRDRELQVATGLGFYSLVSLLGTMVHSHQVFGWQYFYVDLATACSYLLSLVYWVFSFAQQEVARCEMAPETQDFLLGIADMLHQQQNRLSEPTISS
jgi:hypothetical protein